MTPIPFNGINDLQSAFNNFNVKRLSRAFLHVEVSQVAFALGKKIPTSNNLRTESQKIAYLKEQLDYEPTLAPRTCDCATAPAGLRWQRFDSANAKPLAVSMDLSVPEYFHSSISKQIQHANLLAHRFDSELSTFGNTTSSNIIIEYGNFDGNGRTLGVTTYYTVDGSDDLESSGRPIHIMIDSADFPIGSDLNIFEFIFLHEFYHAMSYNHTPKESDQGSNTLDAFFTGIVVEDGWWDLSEHRRSYGLLLT